MSLVPGLFWLTRSVDIRAYSSLITTARTADGLISHPSIFGPSMISHVPFVGLSLGLGMQQIKYAHSPYRDTRSHARSQHYEAKHNRCSECDREFGSKNGLENVLFCLQV